MNCNHEIKSRTWLFLALKKVMKTQRIKVKWKVNFAAYSAAWRFLLPTSPLRSEWEDVHMGDHGLLRFSAGMRKLAHQHLANAGKLKDLPNGHKHKKVPIRGDLTKVQKQNKKKKNKTTGFKKTSFLWFNWATTGKHIPKPPSQTSPSQSNSTHCQGSNSLQGYSGASGHNALHGPRVCIPNSTA